MSESEEHLMRHLHEAVKALTCAIGGLSEQGKSQQEWFKSRFELATLHDLKQMEKRIMATQAEIIADLKTAIVSLKQVNLDTKDVQTTVNDLKTKITELEVLVANGGSITPELVEAVAEVKALAQTADDNIPNVVPVPPTP